MPNIARSNNNQTMRFGQALEYNKRNPSFKNYAENDVGTSVPDLSLFFFKKAYMR